MLSMGPEQSGGSVCRACGENLVQNCRIPGSRQVGKEARECSVCGYREQLVGVPKLNADVMRQMGWDAGPRRGLSFVGEGLPWRGRVVGIRMTLQWAVEHGPEVERLLERAHRDLVSGWDRRPRKSTIPSSSQARNGVECTHFCGSDRQT